MESTHLPERLREIALAAPPALRTMHLSNLERTLHDVGLVRSRVGAGARVADLGGGLSLFTVGCSLAGMRAVLIDDFLDPINLSVEESALDAHRRHGVEIVERDLVEGGLDLGSASLDAATSFHSMEHWHHSPKRLFGQVRESLRPGGVFILAGPNCVNLRKRLTGLVGFAKWSSMEDWYEREQFRGHVREPDVGDLRYIASSMGLVDVAIVGRNWLGWRSSHWVTRKVTPLVDRALRPFPGLCSDIYMLGAVPQSMEGEAPHSGEGVVPHGASAGRL